MSGQTRVVVIGGGIVGCSVLYHLAQLGWTDVTLCERLELTAGATWHSSGSIALYIRNPRILRFSKYTHDLFTSIEETGQDLGMVHSGSLRLATTPERISEFQHYQSAAKAVGVESTIVAPRKAAELWPLMDCEGVLGALHLPEDSYLNPSDATHALAKAARQLGAQVRTHTAVTGLKRRQSGEWQVETDKGSIIAEHVVSATGFFARQTLGMVGLEPATMALSHQYIVTATVPAVQERRRRQLPRLPILRQPDIQLLVREEGDGLFVSVYEEHVRPIFRDGPPKDFGMELLPAELEAIMPYLEKAMDRVPALQEAGIKTVVNGPLPWTPDFAPLTGPAPGHRNLWLAEGNCFGISICGGVGKHLAHWIVDGDPGIDMEDCDPRRFGDYATEPYVADRVTRSYLGIYRQDIDENKMTGSAPNRTDIHDLLTERGAQFEEVDGWDSPTGFQIDGKSASEDELAALETAAGIVEQACRPRFRISGRGATRFLETVFCAALPKVPGSCIESLALTPRGTIRGRYCVIREADDSFMVVADSMRRLYEEDELRRALDRESEVTIEDLSDQFGSLAIVGPRARDLLNDACNGAISADAPIGHVETVQIGSVSASVLRRPWARGAFFFEVSHVIGAHRAVFLKLMEQAGFALVGKDALERYLTLHGLPRPGAELTQAYFPLEAGLSEQATSEAGSYPTRTLVVLDLVDSEDLDVVRNDAILDGSGRVVGTVTSAARLASGSWVAMGYVLRRAIEAHNGLMILVGEKSHEVSIRSPGTSVDRDAQAMERVG